MSGQGVSGATYRGRQLQQVLDASQDVLDEGVHVFAVGRDAWLADITSCLFVIGVVITTNTINTPPQTGSDSLQGLNEAGEEVGHPAADLRAAVSQTSLVQEGHLEEQEEGQEEEHRSHSVSHTQPQCDRQTDRRAGSDQDGGDVLWLHDEELVVADHGLEELQGDGAVLVAAHVARHQLGAVEHSVADSTRSDGVD